MLSGRGLRLFYPLPLSFYFLRGREATVRYNLGVGALLLQVCLSAGTFLYYYWPTISKTTHPIANTLPYTFSPGLQIQAASLPWYMQVQQLLEAHIPEVVIFWLIGVGVFLVRLAGGWLYLQQLKRTARQVADQAVADLALTIQEYLMLKRPIQILESTRVRVPMVIGIIKPVVLLPIGLASGLSIRQVEAVLAHEFAHIKRADFAVNLLQSAIEVLFFFHPALWWLSARVREERELCCDDVAIDICGDGRILAQALAQIEEFAQAPTLAVALASDRKQLLHRVRRMLGVPVKPFVSNASLAGLTLATLLLLSVSVYAVQQKVDTVDNKPKKAEAKKYHKNAEFSFTDKNTLDYVIWDGKRLPSEQLNRLQHAYQGLQNGTLSLSNVSNETDRDILETILDARQDARLEVQPQLFTQSTGSLLASNQPASVMDIALLGTAMPDQALLPTAVNVVSTIDSIPDETGEAILYQLRASKRKAELDRLNTMTNAQMDSLGRLTESLNRQMEVLRLQQERENFKVEEFQRKAELLNWKKQKAHDQRMAAIEKNRQMLYNNSKQKMAEADIEKLVNEGEAKVKESEAQIEALSKELEKLQKTQEEVRQPYSELERQMQQLERQQQLLLEQQDRHFGVVARALRDRDVTVTGYGYTIAPGSAYAAPRATRPRLQRVQGMPRAARLPRVPGVPSIRATAPIPAVEALTPPAAPDAPAIAPEAESIYPATPRSKAPKPAKPAKLKKLKLSQEDQALMDVFSARTTSLAKLMDQDKRLKTATLRMPDGQHVKGLTATIEKH